MLLSPTTTYIPPFLRGRPWTVMAPLDLTGIRERQAANDRLFRGPDASGFFQNSRILLRRVNFPPLLDSQVAMGERRTVDQTERLDCCRKLSEQEGRMSSSLECGELHLR
ncbi:hypothetical protein AVEN_166875-1 [Araneus ventricosus]|uniref:Uncharacterized protein n=1 Tax=Araneus ventricosus TaxID=182803 RepID=A0A4Y2HA34_ARAVE|nr:hypothetical protein AVEN_166875-1 [Araneus ventricosus]